MILLFFIITGFNTSTSHAEMPAQTSMLLEQCGRYLLVGKLDDQNRLIIFPGTLSEAVISLSQITPPAAREYRGKWVKTLVDLRGLHPLQGRLALQDGLTEEQPAYAKDQVIQVIRHEACEGSKK